MYKQGVRCSNLDRKQNKLLMNPLSSSATALFSDFFHKKKFFLIFFSSIYIFNHSYNTFNYSVPEGLPYSSDGKESACNAGDLGSIPGSGSSPGKWNGHPLQYSCLGIPWTEEPGRLYSPWGPKESDTTKWLTHTQNAFHRAVLLGSLIIPLSPQVPLPNKVSCFFSLCVSLDNSFPSVR